MSLTTSHTPRTIPVDAGRREILAQQILLAVLTNPDLCRGAKAAAEQTGISLPQALASYSLQICDAFIGAVYADRQPTDE